MSVEHATTPQAERLENFLAAWRSYAPESSRVRRLNGFLSAFRQHRPSRPIMVARRTFEPGKLRSFLTAAQEPLERMRASGAAINPWAIAGVGQQEVRNTAVLATLWSPQSCGALGRAFLNAFCRQINDPAGLLPTREELAAFYVVRTEHCPEGAVSERVDITIEGPSFVLGIEVKINAAEGPEQLYRYTQSVARWARQRGGKRACVVFLAPYASTNPAVLNARWGDLTAAGRDVLRAAAGEVTMYGFLLDTFIRHCGDFGGKHGRHG